MLLSTTETVYKNCNSIDVFILIVSAFDKTSNKSDGKNNGSKGAGIDR